jgi:protein-S-isoprenylcysteine O-methyltransferase Ste14
MVPIKTLIPFIAFFIVMFGTPLVILLLGVLNFRRDSMRQARSALQALAALAIWAILTFIFVGVNLMLPFTVHYPATHADDLKFVAVAFGGGLIYALVGGALIYWTKRQTKRRPAMGVWC